MWVVWNLNQIFRPTQREQSSSLHYQLHFFFKRKKQDGKPTLLGLASLIYSTNQLKISFSFAVYTFDISSFYGCKVAKGLNRQTFFCFVLLISILLLPKRDVPSASQLTITCLELSAAQCHVTAVKTQLGKYLGSSPKFQAQFKATWSIIQPHSHDWLSSDWCRIQDRYKGSTLKTHRILDTLIILEKRISQK